MGLEIPHYVAKLRQKLKFRASISPLSETYMLLKCLSENCTFLPRPQLFKPTTPLVD